ncbi:MAG: hypothetical protein ACKOKC_07770, partial [Chthoniobacterales bacterium]
LDIIEKLGKLGGFVVPRRDCPQAPWDVHCSLLSGEKLGAAVGWRPRVDLDSGLKRSLRDAGFSAGG